jgi:hypothetical protein
MAALPSSGDIRHGIRDWADDSGDLGNNEYGDCVVAAFEQLRKCHEVKNGSNWRKILYQLGFKPPHTPYTIEVYAEYLATQGLTPSATNGVDPASFLPWAQSKGMLKEWGSVPPSGATFTSGDSAVLEAAMLAHDGLILGVTLTPSAYGSQAKPGGKWIVNSTPTYQPKPGLFHAIALVEYNPTWLCAVTWCFQVYLSPEWLETCAWGAWYFDL